MNCLNSVWVFIGICCFVACKPAEVKKTATTLSDTIVKKEPANPVSAVDQSPMDISYYPADYPLLKMNGSANDHPKARLLYSRPRKKGRTVFGHTAKSLCIHGRAWRLGANEATEIEFFYDLIIAGKPVEKGRYIIYCIPQADKWEIRLNSNLFTWGLHMDHSKDVFATEVPVDTQDPVLEEFTMVFLGNKDSANLLMAWDQTKVLLPMVFQMKK